MKNFIKFSLAAVAGVAILGGFGGEAKAAGPYSCSNATYGSAYSSCSTNNTANQASTVATATTVLRTATTKTAGLVSDRVSAALSGNAANVQMASNGFSASSGLSAGDLGGKAGVWLSGSWSDVEDDNTDTAYEGHAAVGLIGADYQVAPGVVLGLSFGYENVDIDTAYNGFNGNDGSIEGDGYTIAPYIGVKFSDRLTANLTAGYSDIEYDTLRFDPNTGNRITGSTDADRYFVSAALDGTYDLRGNWGLKTRGSVFYASEDKDSFTETESNGATTAVASNDTELGQFGLETRLSYDFDKVQPYALLGLEYDFSKDDTPVAAGQTSSDDDFGVKLGAGVNLINLGSNVSGGLEAYTVEGRDDYNEYTVSGGLRVKF